MSDGDFYVVVKLTKGHLVGRCFRCREPSCGSFSFDEETVTLSCVSCGAKDVLDVKEIDLELMVIGGDRV